MKAAISRAVTRVVTSPALRDARRLAARTARRIGGRPAVVHYFHQADDPYSHLAAQTLASLAARYRVVVAAHLVPSPDDDAAPDRVRLAHWSRRDAALLATAYGLAFDDRAGERPDPDATAAANAALALAIAQGRFAADAPAIGAALWRGETVPTTGSADAEAALREGGALRARLGHYLGATFRFGGEWYWGVDRLHHLEARLAAEGLVADPARPPVAPLREVSLATPAARGRSPTLDFFCSLRSPYTYLAVPRARRLAAHYGAQLRLRFVLPMVMRGLPVPLAKRLYILRDAKREAERLGLPFGRVADPVGTPVERGLAVLHRAIGGERGPAFLESFLQGVFADGIDAGSDAGLARIAGRAGIDRASVAAALADGQWRAVADRNRAELLALGLWGVPSFRVDDGPARWGQDRLWAVERDLAGNGAMA